MSINKNRIGEINYNNQGLKMWIKEYRGCNDIDVEFEDGFISYNNFYSAFKTKKVLNPNFNRVTKIDRTGEVNYNKHGSKMTIINYNNANDVIIKFESGDIENTTYKNFKIGNIKSLYDKTVYNIGYLGEGKYKPKVNKKLTIQYTYWQSMLTRCYDKKYHEKQPTYKDVTCCEEWLNFQNFSKWFDENYYEIDGQTMNLDKDILVKGNKIYSPDNCIFTPQRINVLFVKSDGVRGDYPIGVCYDKKRNKYRAYCSTYEKNKKQVVHLGRFNIPHEAFYKGYKPFKEQYIKQVADDYKEHIPENLYNAMYNYVVEITD